MRNLKRVVATTMLGIMLMGSTSAFAFEVRLDRNYNEKQPKEKQFLVEGKKLIVPEGATLFRSNLNSSYYNDKIEEVVLPESLPEIHGMTFANMMSLTKVNIPKNVKKIGTMAFKNSGIESIILPEGLVELEAQAFELTRSLKKIEIPGTVKGIEYYTFTGSGVQEVIINEGVKYIKDAAFEYTTIKKLYIPASVKTIEYRAFTGESGSGVGWFEDKTRPNLTIYAPTGSVGHQFAVKNGIKFESTGGGPVTPPVVTPPPTKPGEVVTPPVVKPPTEKPAEVVTATPTSSKVRINGKEVAFDAYNINNNNYFKLRDVAYAINGTKKQFNVEWLDYKQAINLDYYSNYTVIGGELKKGDGKVKQGKLNTSQMLRSFGVAGVAEMTAYNIGGNNYVKLRDIGKERGFGVKWNGSTNTIDIDTNSDYVAE